MESGIKPVRVFSYGAGRQSTACLVLGAQGLLHYDYWVFCNVGQDSENPKVLDYFHNVTLPYAKEHGINLIEIHKLHKDKSINTIYQTLTNPKLRSIGIPVRMSPSGAPSQRSCTVEYKIRLCERWIRAKTPVGKILAKEKHLMRFVDSIAKWSEQIGIENDTIYEFSALAERMITIPRPLATVALGISTDEWHRARKDSGVEWKALEYPLLQMELSRDDCIRIVEEAGLPPAPESSCYFCPFHTTEAWQKIRREQPIEWRKSVELDELLRQKAVKLGRGETYLHRSLKPLDQAIPDEPISAEQTAQERQEQCVEGGCFL